MRSSLLHGISDERGRHDCLYVIFSSQDELDRSTLGAMEILLRYLDTALRRVAPLPHVDKKMWFPADSLRRLDTDIIGGLVARKHRRQSMSKRKS